MSAMGDVAMTVPVIASLLQQNPNLKVTILTRSFFTPMFSQLPHTTIYEADVKGSHKGVLGLWRLSKELKQLGITEVADLHNVLRSTILKSFFSFSGMPFITIDKGRKEKKILTKLAAKNISPLKTTHERYADVFRKLGYSLALSEKVVLEKEKPTENLLPFLGKPSNTCIGIAPFAAFSGKMYPLELMENVIQQITKVSHHTVLLFGGGKKEIDQLQKWASTFPNGSYG